MNNRNRFTIAIGAAIGLLSIVSVWAIHSCQPRVVKTHPSVSIEPTAPIAPIVPKPIPKPLTPVPVPIKPSVPLLPPTLLTPPSSNARCYLLIVTPDQAKLENIKCPMQ